MGELTGGVSSTPQVALDHQVQEDGDRLLLSWDSVDALFPDGMLDDMFDAYRRLLALLADDAWSWADPMPSLVPTRHVRLIDQVNETAAPLEPATLHGLFLRQAAARPQQPAVVASGVTLTYADVERRSRSVADWIRRQDPGRDELVAIVMEKGWEQVVGALGVLRAGSAYLPIDPALPAERRLHLLERGRTRVVLTQSRVDQALNWPAHVRRCCVDERDPEDGDTADDRAEWSRLAYVIFTSGSTGQPKGVMIDHRGAVNTIVDLNARFDIGASDRVLGLSSLGFDLSVYDVFGTLGAGGTLVLPRPGSERDPEHWADLVRTHGVTLWNSVPALFEMLVDHLAGRPGAPLATLRLVWMSGDWIPVALPDRARAIEPRMEIISMGGATEGSIWSIFHRIGEVDQSRVSIPYGRPLLNQQFHVFDHNLRPRAVGVPGDLYIGGIGVALGYWRDSEKTTASFVSHPANGERLYRTGDVGRWMPDGNIEFLGREDGQVKIGGMRIELGEIETALGAHPGVRQCTVVARHLTGDAPGDASAASKRRLVAFVVPSDGGREIAESSLRAWLEQKLPSGMIPTRFVTLTSLPLSSNGKVDVKALPVPLVTSGPGARSLSNDEAAVRAMWAEALAVPAEMLGPDDNFFDVGGTSLGVVRLARAISDKTGQDISILTLFEHSTISGMAQLIKGAAPAAPAEDSRARAARRKQQLSARRAAREGPEVANP
jgi:amino acid adenylation domain-containing protein